MFGKMQKLGNDLLIEFQNKEMDNEKLFDHRKDLEII